MKVLAFAATTSRQSINKMLVTYATTLLDQAEVEMLDLNDFEMPIYSTDREQELGQLEPAQRMIDHIKQTDAVMISFAEHNGNFTVAFKNVFDWCSRIEKKMFQGKPMLLLATSPGARGAQSALRIATESFPHFDGVVKASLSIPSFQDNFDVDKQILTNVELQQQLQQAVQSLIS